MKMKSAYRRLRTAARWVAMVLLLSIQHLLEGAWRSDTPNTG
ncbi:hypothetical protein RB2501_07685 [Robiginitalea biformata HTCC2501]|uniref:Uncharacterized protein n=1 Tax=Robiginitalea biformata (strain ATCC BAA-864 / DSM 15991 / KCTC 12146 / HTCC2501) TaxID=313596 RepID=A4CIK7_ROBBH|nr:hypothetical protein RB2501_07685 [Robiginitalea biformata HTCC2501]